MGSNYSVWGVASWGLFFVLLFAAVISDIRERRVSNRLTGAILFCGVGYAVFTQGAWNGIATALGGALTGLAIWLPMYALRLMGAGDVKLFSAGSAWLGWQAALVGALSTGLLGGALGFFWLWHQKGWTATGVALFQSMKAPHTLQLRPMDRRERVPYALAIAGGLVCGWWWVVLPEWHS